MRNYSKVEHMKFSMAMLVLLSSMVIMIMLSGCSSNQTYTIYGTITSGSSALSGVTVTLSGDGSAVATTDANGNYSFSVSNYSLYNVTPSLPGYTFNPSYRIAHIVGNSGSGFTFSGIADGATHTVYLKSDATVWAWGNNSNGQLGNGNTTPNHTPAQISSLSGMLAIVAGNDYTVALKNDGTVWACGNNSNGQLGNNSTADSYTPVQVNVSSGLSGVTAIAAGNAHTVAIDGSGVVWTWGYNTYGQLGNNSTTDSSIPVSLSSYFPSGTVVTAIAAGYDHTVALDSSGTVWTWGYNNNGQLGNNSVAYSLIPVSLSTYLPATVKAIAAGYEDTIALDSVGTVWTWGYNSYGQLGNNSITNSLIPVSLSTYFPLGSVVKAIAAGYDHTVALDSGSTVWTWGHNNKGQLGNNSVVDSLIPVSLSAFLPATVIAVAAGYEDTIAMKNDGTVWTWGYNFYGQLGNGTTTDSPIPVKSLLP